MKFGWSMTELWFISSLKGQPPVMTISSDTAIATAIDGTAIWPFTASVLPSRHLDPPVTLLVAAEDKSDLWESCFYCINPKWIRDPALLWSNSVNDLINIASDLQLSYKLSKPFPPLPAVCHSLPISTSRNPEIHLAVYTYSPTLPIAKRVAHWIVTNWPTRISLRWSGRLICMKYKRWTHQALFRSTVANSSSKTYHAIGAVVKVCPHVTKSCIASLNKLYMYQQAYNSPSNINPTFPKYEAPFVFKTREQSIPCRSHDLPRHATGKASMSVEEVGSLVAWPLGKEDMGKHTDGRVPALLGVVNWPHHGERAGREKWK